MSVAKIDKEILNDGDINQEDEELIFNPYNSNNKEITEKQVSDILRKLLERLLINTSMNMVLFLRVGGNKILNSAIQYI